jgi:hypothetical protein
MLEVQAEEKRIKKDRKVGRKRSSAKIIEEQTISELSTPITKRQKTEYEIASPKEEA